MVWHGVDKSGRPTPTGMYFYQMTTQNQTITKRMMYLK
ncbi:MAG: T9SS type A sorting domain-containing protein [Candidatus Delongbacteria bacterium]|nr:T9SS type A sorting domain-containing protein [Candidatus Delongbacteria bacterium]